MAAPPSSADAHVRVFDSVAWIYGLLFPLQRRAYRRVFRAHRGLLDLTPGARVLDIGCGPGAFASILADRGYEVWAVDASPVMLETARRKLRGRPVRVLAGDVLEGLRLPDRHFDLVLACHVVHGFPFPERERFYREARRVSRGRVLFHDFPPREMRRLGGAMRALEGLERSDFRRFTRRGVREMEAAFGSVRVYPAGSAAWYLCAAAGPA